MNLGSLGYGLASLAFTLLTLLLLAAWRGRREGIRVLVACGVTACWAGALASQAHVDAVPWMWLTPVEMLRDGAWLFVLGGIAAPLIGATWVRVCYLVWGACLALGLVSPLLASVGLVDWSPAMVLSRTGLLLSVINLLLLEQIYQNASPTGRAALRSFVLGFGALMAYDVFLYSQAELLRGVAADAWNARGFINAAAVPVIALAVRAQPLWAMDVFVSRQFVLYTTSLAAVGGYLVAMAIGGYWVRNHGGSWGGIAQIVFLGAAVALLVLLVMSDSLRRHAKVFVSKHFYRNKYDYRLEWLRFVETLSGSDEPDVRRVCIQAVAQIFSSPSGVLYVYHPDVSRYVPAARWPESLHGEPHFPEIEESIELVKLLRGRHWIVDLEEGGTQEDLRSGLQLPAALRENKAARIIAPILQLDRLIGFVLLYSPPEPFELTYEDRDLLRTVGRHIATHLAQQEADRALAEGRQFDAYNKLTAFMMHDLKNSVAQLKLIVANAQRHKHNPEFIDDVIDTTANTVERISRLIEQLRNADVPQPKAVSLSAVIATALQRCQLRKPTPAVSGGIPNVHVSADRERLTVIFEHVLRNAQDATPEHGQVRLTFTADATSLTAAIEDTGSGMDPEFLRERLFRPFDSTKGAKGMGVGAYQVREYVRSLGGQVKVQSTPGRGTTFYITLPLASSTIVPNQNAEPVAALAVDQGP